MPIEMPPHPEPNMHNTFMTRYDYDYTGPMPTHYFLRDDSGSGFTSNRPIFGRPQTMDGSMVSMLNTLHKPFNRRLAPEDMADAAAYAAQSRVVATAFSREAGVVPVPGEPMTTSMKSVHVPKAIPGYTGPMPMWGAHAPTVLKPDFFTIHSPEDPPKEAKAAQKYPPTGVHPGRVNLITAAGGPGSYFQHSRLIGDRTLAYPSQLPKGLGEASECNLTATMTNKRELLTTLGGRRSNSCSLPRPIFETNPITMSQPQQDTCRVAHRLENEGHFMNTTYHSHFVNQKNLPELADPSKDRRAKGPVQLLNLPSSNNSTASLTNSRGELLEERPSTVHPSVWRRMKAVEASQRVDKVDPHAHKRRTTVE
jgi:hypothetical protein